MREFAHACFLPVWLHQKYMLWDQSQKLGSPVGWVGVHKTLRKETFWTRPRLAIQARKVLDVPEIHVKMSEYGYFWIALIEFYSLANMREFAFENSHTYNNGIKNKFPEKIIMQYFALSVCDSMRKYALVGIIMPTWLKLPCILMRGFLYMLKVSDF